MDVWLDTGCAKVALQCPDEASLVAISKLAKSQGLPQYIIRDAGRTQISAGSKTVVVVGPAPKSKVDTITGDLKLL
jgi:PTH2 family peptidyl-tRNA hydrolase